MSFTFLFYQHIMFRHSCGKCHFTNIQRPSDITIADFWGIEKVDPNINSDDKGVSLILINTEKDKNFLKQYNMISTLFQQHLTNAYNPT